MEYMDDYSADGARLAGVVQGVRNRWRLKRALRGASIVLAGGFVMLLVSALALDALRYGGTAVTIFRVVGAVVLAALAIWFVVLPLLPSRAPDDRRVALYLEEHEPSLDASLLTAVELGTASQRSPGSRASISAARSPALFARLLQTALERVRRIDDGRHVDERELHLTAGVLAIVAAAALLMTLLAPSTLRHGFKLLLTPWDSGQPLSLYAIAVDPGNVTVARGGDLLLAARLRGFESDEVDLLLRQRDSTTWSRVPMALDSTGRHAGRYTFRLFDVKAPMEYVVESNGVRSPSYRIDVADLPYTKRLGLEYHFPAYTGLAPQSVDDGGDVAAPRGTQVRVRVTTTVPARTGRLIVDRGDAGSDTVALAPTGNGMLSGVLRVDRAGFYRVELQAADGRMLPASLDYTIDVLPDRPPTVSIGKPGRDIKVLSVDEVYTEARAEDDFGVQRLDLVYSVNGGTEQTIRLYDAGSGRAAQTSASHTFELENFKLQPGDVVSYYARATDNDAVNGAKSATSDIYFLQVRPYVQEYQQDQSGGGGGGGGQNDDAGQLSQRQREIIAATFNTARDRANTPQKELEENIATLRLSQQRLREQVQELARRLVDRGIASRDSNFARIAEILPKAAAEMDSAERQLAAGDAQKALQPEQRALQQLQHAEAVFRNVRVSMGAGGGGGSAGGNQPRADDLADLFELNREKLRNQYESVQHGQERQQQSDQTVDAAIERLKRLAARQQQENERALRKADSLAQRMGATGSSGGASQRELAQQAEETARQLERLARDRQQEQQREAPTPQQSSSSASSQGAQSSGQGGSQSQQETRALEDAARRLRDAANAMRRSASESTSPERATAEGAAALRQLEEAQRLLNGERSGRLSRDVDEALRSAKALGEEEQRVGSDMDKLLQGGQGDPQRAQRMQSLNQQKGEMANQVRDLKGRLDRMALDSRRDNPEASRGLDQAAGAMRDRKLEEKIRASQGAMRYAEPEYSRGLESSIGEDIGDLQKRLEQVATTARQGKSGEEQRRAEAMQKARQLIQDLSSLDARLRAQSRQQGTPGQQPASGSQSQGQQGQRSAQGRGQSQPQSGQTGQSQSQSRGGQPSPQGRGGGGSGRYAGTQGGQSEGSPPSGASSRELRERLSDAESLRKELAGQGVPLSELDRAIGGLRNLADQRFAADERAAAALRSQTLQQLQAFEFALRRSFGAEDDERMLLGRSGEVPPAFRQDVEEYYRALARSKQP